MVNTNGFLPMVNKTFCSRADLYCIGSILTCEVTATLPQKLRRLYIKN